MKIMNLLQMLAGSINTIYTKFLKDEKIEEGLPIYYIGGNISLPPPLTEEEEKDILKRLDEGNTSLRQTPVERNLKIQE